MTNVKRFIICAGGIFVCFFVFAILQEKIVRGQYGTKESPEQFTCVFALVFVQCIINYLFAKFLLLTVWKQTEDTTKTSYYAICSLTYLLAMVCSNMALQFVNYPTQVIGKSAKPLPVMILGVFLANKSYPIRKYFFVLLVVLGLIMFMYKDTKKSHSTQKDSSFSFGEILIILSLIMDGLTTSCQERMKSEHKTKSVHMMMNMNYWSSVYSLIVCLLSGELFNFVAFLQRNPVCISWILIFSLTGAVGQYFIYMTITEFGPLPCAIVTTTRKFFTMLFSVIFFGNALLLRQWIAGIIVFVGLFLDAFYGKSSAPKKEITK